MVIEDWQQRVIDEAKELRGRLNKLRKFLDKLPESSAHALLYEQYYVMQRYHEILEERVKGFYVRTN